MTQTMKSCTECGSEKILARSRCEGCYRAHVARLKQAGAFVALASGRPSIPAVEKVFARSVPGLNGCVLYTGLLCKDGYGLVSEPHKQSRSRAHRVAYEHEIGTIPAGHQLDHLCHTQSDDCPGGRGCQHRRCVNPYHLEPVTPAENTHRSLGLTATNARKTHCPRGHPYSPENTKRDRRSRHCRTCVNERRRNAARSKRNT